MTNLRARMLASIVAMGYDGDARDPIDESKAIEYEFGSAANRANRQYSVAATIATSTTDTRNFNGALADAFGEELDLSALKAVLIVNTGTVPIVLGGTCPIVAAVTIEAGGFYMVATPSAAGYAASEAVAGTITLENESASVVAAYELHAIGID